jgi:hypothetical protein
MYGRSVEQWMNHYICPSAVYFDQFKQLAMDMVKGQAADKLQGMFDRMLN